MEHLNPVVPFLKAESPFSLPVVPFRHKPIFQEIWPFQKKDPRELEGTARTCPNLQSSELPTAPGRTTCLDRALARSPPSFRPKPRETIKPSLPPHDMGLSSNTDTIVMFPQTFHFNFAPAFVGAFCKVFSLIHDPVTPPQETREATTNKNRGQNWPKSLTKKGQTSPGKH